MKPYWIVLFRRRRETTGALDVSIVRQNKGVIDIRCAFAHWSSPPLAIPDITSAQSFSNHSFYHITRSDHSITSQLTLFAGGHRRRPGRYSSLISTGQRPQRQRPRCASKSSLSFSFFASLFFLLVPVDFFLQLQISSQVADCKDVPVHSTRMVNHSTYLDSLFGWSLGLAPAAAHHPFTENILPKEREHHPKRVKPRSDPK